MWPDVGHHTIVVGPRYKDQIRDIFLQGKLAEDMSLYVHRPSVTDPSVAPRGRRHLLRPVPGAASGDSTRRLGSGGRNPTAEDEIAGGAPAPRLRHISDRAWSSPPTLSTATLPPFGGGFSIEPRILQSAWFRPHNVSEEAAGPLPGRCWHPSRRGSARGDRHRRGARHSLSPTPARTPRPKDGRRMIVPRRPGPLPRPRSAPGRCRSTRPRGCCRQVRDPGAGALCLLPSCR